MCKAAEASGFHGLKRLLHIPFQPFLIFCRPGTRRFAVAFVPGKMLPKNQIIQVKRPDQVQQTVEIPRIVFRLKSNENLNTSGILLFEAAQRRYIVFQLFRKQSETGHIPVVQLRRMVREPQRL